MSERYGLPDHAPRHDEPLQNPTPQGSWGYVPAQADTEWPTIPTTAAPASYGAGAAAPVIVADRRKSVKLAIFLAMILGPLGLFYVSFLNGVVALFVVVPLARQLAFAAVLALDGRIEVLTAIIPILWCITVPWAIVGVQWRNRKLKSLP